MAAAPHTIVPGISQTDINIFLYSLKFNLDVSFSTTTETINQINDFIGAPQNKPIITNGYDGKNIK